MSSFTQNAHALAVERADGKGAQTAIDSAIEIARRLKSEPLELTAMEIQLSFRNQNTDWDNLKIAATQVVEMALRLGDQGKELRGHYFLGMANLGLGNLAAAQPELQTMLELSESLNRIHNIEQALTFISGLHLMRGEWAEAIEASKQQV